MHCDSEMSKEKFQKKLPSEIVIVLKELILIFIEIETVNIYQRGINYETLSASTNDIAPLSGNDHWNIWLRWQA